MNLNEIVIVVAAIAATASVVAVAARGSAPPGLWWVPAVGCAVFFAWSAYAVADGGLLGFWPLHAASPWGAQVFMDLILMAAVASVALVPRLRAQGISPWPWLLLVGATGSIGMLATVARLLHAESSTPAASPVAQPVGAR